MAQRAATSREPSREPCYQLGVRCLVSLQSLHLTTLLLFVVVMLSNDAAIATTNDERTSAAASCLREQRALAAAAASQSFGLATETAEAVNPQQAALAAGVVHATRGGGLWHVPSPPPPPLPQLAVGECPSKSAFGCRERDRPRFSAVEWRLRRDAYATARARHRDARRIATDDVADLNAESGGDTDLPSSDGDNVCVGASQRCSGADQLQTIRTVARVCRSRATQRRES